MRKGWAVASPTPRSTRHIARMIPTGILTRSPDPPALPILRPPSWPVGEDEATRLALPYLGWGGGILCGCTSPNSNVGARTAGTSWAVVVHGLTTVHIVA